MQCRKYLCKALIGALFAASNIYRWTRYGAAEREGDDAATRLPLVNSFNQTVLSRFDELHRNLIRGDNETETVIIECGTDVDCPVHYNPASIQQHIDYMDQHRRILQPIIDARYLQARQNAAKQCEVLMAGTHRWDVPAQQSGGWCLEKGHTWVGCETPSVKTCDIQPHDHEPIPVPEHHAIPSQVVTDELVSLIDSEDIASFSDFGAGIGQYKAAVQNQRPNVSWTSYDGAGNVERWTNGYVQWIDLTQPLSLPVADWVLSLEVGEHIPNRYEGIFLQNLHRHNCRGLILSWAVLGQGGKDHVNCHSGTYVTSVIEGMGYTLDEGLTQRFRRDGLGQYHWFKESILVFRRDVNPCR